MPPIVDALPFAMLSISVTLASLAIQGLLYEPAHGFGPVREIWLLSAPIINFGNESVVNPHLKGPVLGPTGRPANFRFCIFGIDRDALVVGLDRLGFDRDVLVGGL